MIDLGLVSLQIAVDTLINDGRISENDVLRAAIRGMENGGQLRPTAPRTADLLEAPPTPLRTAGRRGRPPGSRNKAVVHAQPAVEVLTPTQKRSRKLQGKYLGLLRQIPAADRAQFSEMVSADRKNGRRNAIAAMRVALGKT